MDDDAEPAVKDIVLNEGDRQLVRMAARLLMAQEPGQMREVATERLMQDYRDDLTEAYPGIDAASLDEMAINFSAALLVEMERLADDQSDYSNRQARYGVRLTARPRVIAAIGEMLAALDSRH